MIKKIIIILVFVMAAVLINDHFHSVDMSSHGGKAKVFKTRDDFLFKSTTAIDLAFK